MERLPYTFRVKWRDTVDQTVERKARDVTVADIMKFVTAKARARSHPIFGNVSGEGKKKEFPTKQRMKGPKVDTFSSLRTQEDNQLTDKKPGCPLCSADHYLPRCDNFCQQYFDRKEAPEHFVRTCPKDSFCKVNWGRSKHSTVLRPSGSMNTLKFSESASKDSKIKNPKPSSDSNPANYGFVKSGFASSTTTTGLAIVPVSIKAKDGEEIVQTYTFFDSRSNTSFCT